MIRDLSQLTDRSFDTVVIGGGIHGLAVAYDAAQRGLTVALVERGDIGGGSSFNHAKTVHGGLRSLQTGDIRKARFSMQERRAMARIAPNWLVPRTFLMATTRKLMRSKPIMFAGLTLDACVGFDRNRGVPRRLRLPRGSVLGIDAYRAAFGSSSVDQATGAARWYDYHMPHADRITLAFARAACEHGAVIANYVEALQPIQADGVVTGISARDRETGHVFDVHGRLVINAAGSRCRDWCALLGGHLDYPLIRATNIVSSRPAADAAIAAPTSGGRMLLVMPWNGRSLVGTSHSAEPVASTATAVTADELQAFLDEINSAFPALALTTADVTMVHRGVGPGERSRSGELGLMAHHIIHDHQTDGVKGAMSVVGVKFTTGRGVGEQVVDRALRILGRPPVSGRTGRTLLPGAFVHDPAEEVAQALVAAAGLLSPAQVAGLVATHGTAWRDVLAICQHDHALAAPVDGADGPPLATLRYAVGAEMGRTVVDVLARRTGIAVAGHPGDATVRLCANAMATWLGWDAARVNREVEAVRAYYAPAPVAAD